MELVAVLRLDGLVMKEWPKALKVCSGALSHSQVARLARAKRAEFLTDNDEEDANKS